MIDKLIEKMIATNNPTVVGIDTDFNYLPEQLKKGVASFKDAAEAIEIFNRNIIDSVCDLVPAVKVQIAYYEMYSTEGLKCFLNTLEYAKHKGLIVISDIKRNDIGSTASCYSNAYIGETKFNESSLSAFPSDFITINGYLGTDGIKPFTEDMKKYNKGGFVLVKTSNPSSDELQDLKLESGELIYERMGRLVDMWGKSLIGSYGYSSLGAVVGATKKAQAEKLRAQLASTMFLVPGYGAQGGSAEDLSVCFDNVGLGAIVNSSRGIICAYKAEKYKGMDYISAARAAVIDMQEDILNALKNKGIKRIGG